MIDVGERTGSSKFVSREVTICVNMKDSDSKVAELSVIMSRKGSRRPLKVGTLEGAVGCFHERRKIVDAER